MPAGGRSEGGAHNRLRVCTKSVQLWLELAAAGELYVVWVLDIAQGETCLSRRTDRCGLLDGLQRLRSLERNNCLTSERFIFRSNGIETIRSLFVMQSDLLIDSAYILNRKRTAD